MLELHKKYCYNLYPDTTFFLNLSPQKGLKRTLKRQNISEDRFENLGLNYHQKILNGFDTLQKRDPNRIVKIDADNTKDYISNEISSYVKKLLTINE